MIALVPAWLEAVVAVPKAPVPGVIGKLKRQPSVLVGLFVGHEFLGIEGELKKMRSVPPAVNIA